MRVPPGVTAAGVDDYKQFYGLPEARQDLFWMVLGWPNNATRFDVFNDRLKQLGFRIVIEEQN